MTCGKCHMGKNTVNHEIFPGDVSVKLKQKRNGINYVVTLISIFENEDISMMPTPSLQAKYSSRMKSKNFGL